MEEADFGVEQLANSFIQQAGFSSLNTMMSGLATEFITLWAAVPRYNTPTEDNSIKYQELLEKTGPTLG